MFYSLLGVSADAYTSMTISLRALSRFCFFLCYSKTTDLNCGSHKARIYECNCFALTPIYILCCFQKVCLFRKLLKQFLFLNHSSSHKLISWKIIHKIYSSTKTFP